MLAVRACALPDGALLQRYADDGVYTDCYATDLGMAVSHARYVTAFYTSAVFRLERAILRWMVSRPSTNDQARRLAAGSIDVFAAWRVEARSERQLLLCDIGGRTRSWLMVAPLAGDGGARTRLYFGSAVVPVTGPVPGGAAPGRAWRVMLGLHRLYSVVLLHAARARLIAGRC